MGLSIVEGAKNITVSGVRSKEMWGDGFYLDIAQDGRRPPSALHRAIVHRQFRLPGSALLGGE